MRRKLCDRSSLTFLKSTVLKTTGEQVQSDNGEEKFAMGDTLI